jgi:hypothetical protein
MERRDIRIDFNELISGGTGSSGVAEEFRTIVYPFDKYEVKIVLNSKNEFVDIIEIKLNKDFRSFKQKARLKSAVDEGEFYEKE